MNLEQMSDEELMVMYQNGDEMAFQALYSRHSGRILAFIRSKTSNGELAGDIFQEVFIKVHKSKKLYNKSFDVLPWLFTITRNAIIDNLRKQKNIVVSLGPEVDQLPDDSHDEEVIISEDLAPALLRLPANQRQAIQMRYVDESTFEEIAKQLNTSSENVRQLISRGLKNMKSFFRKEVG